MLLEQGVGMIVYLYHTGSLLVLSAYFFHNLQIIALSESVGMEIHELSL